MPVMIEAPPDDTEPPVDASLPPVPSERVPPVAVVLPPVLDPVPPPNVLPPVPVVTYTPPVASLLPVSCCDDPQAEVDNSTKRGMPAPNRLMAKCNLSAISNNRGKPDKTTTTGPSQNSIYRYCGNIIVARLRLKTICTCRCALATRSISLDFPPANGLAWLVCVGS